MPAARLGLHVPEQCPRRVGEVAQAHRQPPDVHKDRLPVNARNVTLESLHATMHCAITAYVALNNKRPFLDGFRASVL